MPECSVCGQPVKPAYGVTHIGCKHTTHTECTGNQFDPRNCPPCLTGASTDSLVSEPRLLDGRDYVEQPGDYNSLQPSLIRSMASRLIKSKEPAKKTPMDVLNERVPVETMWKRDKYGLDHLLRDGILIDDFIRNRYRLQDVAKFQDVGHEGPRRSLRALVNGLAMTANHLKDHPDLMDIDEFRRLTEIEPYQYHQLMGLHFPEDGPLECDNDDRWSAEDCAHLGLTFDNLVEMGLKWREQYDDLFKGVAQSKHKQIAQQLQATPEKISSLISLEQIAKEERQRAIKKRQEAKRLEAAYQQAEQQFFEQEEEHEAPVSQAPSPPTPSKRMNAPMDRSKRGAEIRRAREEARLRQMGLKL